MSHVILNGARRTFGDATALAGIDLEIEEGELFVLLGPSGCGKTTLLRAIAGLESLDAGTVSLAGEVVTSAERFVAPDRRGLGLVHQDLALWPHLTALQHLLFVIGAGKRDRAAVERCREALADVGIADLADRRPDRISGGERQRLALARALVTSPSLLLLDEPLSSVDPSIGREIRALLARLNAEREMTMLYVTHLQDEAFELAHRIGVMREGRIEQVDAPEAIFAAPRTEFVATFVGAGSVVRGRIDSDRATVLTDVGPLRTREPGEPGATAAVILRESDARCVSPNAGAPAVEGSVLSSIFRGDRYTTRVRIGATVIDARDDQRRRPGDSVGVVVEAADRPVIHGVEA